MKRTGSSDYREQGRHRWGSQLPAHFAGRFSERIAIGGICDESEIGTTHGHMLPVGRFSGIGAVQS